MSKERKWTAPQSWAINCSGREMLLSAGAGSGKTATLTERVCRLVCDGDGDISRMLIVTFTRAAAEELRSRVRERVSQKLGENPDSRRLARQIVALDGADISTMSSFFYKIIRPRFGELGLPPAFTVADEAELAVMKDRVISDVIDDFFEEDDDGVIALSDALSSARDETSLGGVLLNIADSLAAKGYGAERLDEWAAGFERDSSLDFFESPHGEVVKNLTLSFAAHYLKAFTAVRDEFANDAFLREKYLASAEEHISFFNRVAAAAKRGYAQTGEALTTLASTRLPGIKAELKTELSERYSAMKSNVKNELKGIILPLFRYGEEEISKSFTETAFMTRALSRVVGEYNARFREEKSRRGVVDYTDIENYAHRLLVKPDGSPSDAAKSLAKNYDYIFIDEYQDTNALQDSVFSSIAAFVPRFMVGDVKQSIYAFRGGEPSVFVTYREKLPAADPERDDPKEGGGATLYMSENFRSDRPVIDFVNLVSARMFPGTTTPFEDGDRLICKKDQTGRAVTPCEIALIEKGDDPAGVTEGGYIAEKIVSLIERGRRADGTAFKPGDFAVLVRNAGGALHIEEALTSRGIPTTDRAADEFFSSREILLVLCILNAVDNPLRDIYLAGALKSPVFGFTMEDLVRIRLDRTSTPLWYCLTEYASENGGALAERCAKAVEFIERTRLAAKGSDAASLILSIYDAFSLYALTDGADPSSERASTIRENLTALYEIARGFESSSFGGLYGFIEYLNKKMQVKKRSEPPSGVNAVTITTIHKSKGLEYPVCFLARATSAYYTKDLSSGVLFDTALGPAMKLRDSTGLVKYDTALRVVTAAKMKYEKICEEMRVLYVALTRAVERLVVCCTVSDADRTIDACRAFTVTGEPYSALLSKSYADVILSAALNSDESGKTFDIVRVAKDSVGFTKMTLRGEVFETDAAPDPTETIKERLAFVYPREYLGNVPAKVTVSKLSPSLLDEEVTLPPDASASTKREEKKEAPTLRLTNETASGAERGTATHVFLQFCDFERLEARGVEDEIERLKSKKFLTSAMASLVNRDEISRFASSALFYEMRRAKWIRREFRFNALLPAWEFTSDGALAAKLMESGETVTVQGVVDAVFEKEDGSIVLIDYKTDRLSDYEMNHPEAARRALAERHRTQLTYYKAACERIFGREIDEVSVFSLALSDTARVF